MRFGRKNRSRPVQARREVNSSHDGVPGSVASEERNALLFNDTEEGGAAVAAMTAPEPVPFTGADPTQRLLTALGRFHRYVAKGQAGAPQEYWSDDCMNQLVGAVELSAEQNWKQIVEALTGMARVLQTYEMSSSAHLCVPFLNDSYEILCLMVSDIIVNNAGSGAVQAWRTRYYRAVDELTAAGLALVDDEPEPENAPATAEQTAEPEAAVLPFAMPEEEAPTKPAAAAPDEPSIDDFLPFVEGQESEPEDEEAAPFADEAAEPANEPADEPAAEEAVCETAATPKPMDEVAPVLDAVCDDLARLEKATPASYCERLTNIGYRIESLASFAGDNGFKAAAEVSGRMLAICRASALRERLDDVFFDLAYAFCGAYAEALAGAYAEALGGAYAEALGGAYAEALGGAYAEAVQTWLEDGRLMIERLEAGDPAREATPTDSTASEAASTAPDQASSAEPAQGRQETSVEVPEPAPDRVIEDGSPESLLVTAQKAIAHGDMPGAKVLALQAVAHLARAETAKAEARVQEAEAHFQQNAQHIECARQQVKKVEQEVASAESRAAEGSSELADARAHGSLVEEKVAGIEKRVVEIEDQIRALQAAHEAELQRVEAARGELEQAREQENEAEAALARLKENEGAARTRLEESRQSVKDLQRHRLELEEMLSQARETLTHHRSSMADIEKTIAQLRPADGPATEPGEELLFQL